MAAPIVSVVMAVHNGEKYLREAIESILGQSYADFEFVVIDDCSTDTTADILAEFVDADSRVVVQSNTRNIGLGLSLNKGLSIARGRYIARQDADDISLPSRFADQVEFLEKHPAVGLLGTQADFIDSNGGPIVERRWRFALDNDSLQEQLLHFCAFVHGSVMIRRECLDAVGGVYDADVPEDYDLWLRLAEITQVANLNAVLYLYRIHANSITHTFGGDMSALSAARLEQMVKRRNGPTPTESQWIPAARGYARAALVYWLMAKHQMARDLLAHAVKLSRVYFDSAKALEELLAQTADVYLDGDPAEFYNSALFDLFQLLPRKQRASLGPLASRFHMRRVFLASGRSDWGEVQQHLWKGLWYDPKWLLNRGVISISARAIKSILMARWSGWRVAA